jgi:hypothetical protein
MDSHTIILRGLKLVEQSLIELGIDILLLIYWSMPILVGLPSFCMLLYTRSCLQLKVYDFHFLEAFVFVVYFSATTSGHNLFFYFLFFVIEQQDQNQWLMEWYTEMHQGQSTEPT